MNNEQMIQNPAGFWVRFAALFLDGIIIGIPLAIAGIIFSDNLSVKNLWEKRDDLGWGSTLAIILPMCRVCGFIRRESGEPLSSPLF